jgi:hypothetical protein
VVELARRVETSSAPIVPHALLFSPPREPPPPDFVVLLLAPLAPGRRAAAAQCLGAGLSRLCHGPGGLYVWKAVPHLLLPESVDRLLLLDADAVVVRPLSALWAHFAPIPHTMLASCTECRASTPALHLGA